MDEITLTFSEGISQVFDADLTREVEASIRKEFERRERGANFNAVEEWGVAYASFDDTDGKRITIGLELYYVFNDNEVVWDQSFTVTPPSPPLGLLIEEGDAGWTETGVIGGIRIWYTFEEVSIIVSKDFEQTVISLVAPEIGKYREFFESVNVEVWGTDVVNIPLKHFRGSRSRRSVKKLFKQAGRFVLPIGITATVETDIDITPQIETLLRDYRGYEVDLYWDDSSDQKGGRYFLPVTITATSKATRVRVDITKELQTEYEKFLRNEPETKDYRITGFSLNSIGDLELRSGNLFIELELEVYSEDGYIWDGPPITFNLSQIGGIQKLPDEAEYELVGNDIQGNLDASTIREVKAFLDIEYYLEDKEIETKIELTQIIENLLRDTKKLDLEVNWDSFEEEIKQSFVIIQSGKNLFVYGIACTDIPTFEGIKVNQSAMPKMLETLIHYRNVYLEHQDIPVGFILPEQNVNGKLIQSRIWEIPELLRSFPQLRSRLPPSEYSNNHALCLLIELANDTEIAKEVQRYIRSGEITGLSIRGEILEGKEVCDENGCILDATNLDCPSVVFCVEPKDRQARITVLNSDLKKEVENMPFDSFEECVNHMKNKEGVSDPEALCAWLCHEQTGKWPAEQSSCKICKDKQRELARTRGIPKQFLPFILNAVEAVLMEKKVKNQDDVPPEPAPSSVEERVASLEAEIAAIKEQLAQLLGTMQSKDGEEEEEVKESEDEEIKEESNVEQAVKQATEEMKKEFDKKFRELKQSIPAFMRGGKDGGTDSQDNITFEKAGKMTTEEIERQFGGE
ncbi:TPA_asm: hypothetical protein vir519_00022 [Caudoviricetes sp. vir519]|nr:TPA_asm: hypothetical protein vir519_00022 [Caudoviricetes sp. vir519]